MGALSYGYDANGNPASLVYPGGVEAVTTFDYADRPATLLARRAGRSTFRKGQRAGNG